MRLRACLHVVLFGFITGEIGRDADVWRVVDGVSTQVKYLSIVTAGPGIVNMSGWQSGWRAVRGAAVLPGRGCQAIIVVTSNIGGSGWHQPRAWHHITRHNHHNANLITIHERNFRYDRALGLKSNVINRGSVRCFLIISVTIMNCFNAVNVVLVSWDQLQVESTLETNQWSSVAWSWWRRLSSVWHAAQTTGHWSILRKLTQELIPNIFTSGWPQFVIKSDVN